MEFVQQFFLVFWPFISTLAGMAIILLAANWISGRINAGTASLGYQVFNLMVIVFATVTAIITLPLTDETQGQVLSLLGVVLTAVIAISSTTFVANAMAGFLPEMKYLLTARSRSRKKTLEQMHGHGVEIVSPTFMNQRQIEPDRKVMPDTPVLHARQGKQVEPDGPAPEEMIFDKAEEAANVEEIKQQHEDVKQTLKQLKAELKEADESSKLDLEEKIAALEVQLTWLLEQRKENAVPV